MALGGGRARVEVVQKSKKFVEIFEKSGKCVFCSCYVSFVRKSRERVLGVSERLICIRVACCRVSACGVLFMKCCEITIF